VKRAFVVVIDACGAGELPDAAAYGDAGSNTLGHLASAVGGLQLPVLERLGLGSILPLEGVQPSPTPAIHGRLYAIGPGKDSTAGHWELMGVVAPQAPPTYPDGFPASVITVITDAAGGRAVICNRPFNGLDVIDEFGAEHLRTGGLIVYTSQDSVLQIAAHEDVVSTAELHAICADVRARLPAEHAVGRVIARPFRGVAGAFERTGARRDLALAPPTHSYMDTLQRSGVPVHTVGKAGQLFSGKGIDRQHPGATNAIALEQTETLIDELAHGLVFTNLIETDQTYGHRHDAEGFHAALREIDTHLGRWLPKLGEDDLLIITADHGVDVTAKHTDHTREHVPLIALIPGSRGFRHDGMMSDVGAVVLYWLAGTEDHELPGAPFISSALP
jgi:phosphopentomutase